MYLCLDLSLKSTGYSIFTKDGKLLKKGKIVPTSDINNSLKIHFIVNKIKSLFLNVEDLIIEDVYYGKNFNSVMWLSRLSGGVIFAWVDGKYKKPKFYKATQARFLAGISGNSHKAEVQIFVLSKYRYTTLTNIKKYKVVVDKLKKDYKSKTIKRGTYKYQLDKLSKIIELETGIGEDLSDSIILGLAFINDK